VYTAVVETITQKYNPKKVSEIVGQGKALSDVLKFVETKDFENNTATMSNSNSWVGFYNCTFDSNQGSSKAAVMVSLEHSCKDHMEQR